MEPDSVHAVDTVIVGLQKIHEQAEQLGLHEVAHLASTALLAAEEEAERRIIRRRGVHHGGESRDVGTVLVPARQSGRHEVQEAV